MYQITFPDGQTVTTEKPQYIYVHKSGCFIRCEERKAEGVAWKNSPFLFKDGTTIRDVDAGELFITADEMAAAIREGVNEV